MENARLQRILGHFTQDNKIRQKSVQQNESAYCANDALFLGLDSSTQSVKATFIDVDANVVYEEGLNFDKDLSHYKTEGGVYAGQGPKGLTVTAPSLMFVEAIDVLLTRISQKGSVDLAKVVAISASGQQHGSVYWALGSRFRLNTLSARSDLKTQLKDAFATPDGPIWMDSSTEAYCRQMENLSGGPQRVADISGSRAYERFTGSQISKIIDQKPDVYARCERISLVSSFIVTLLTGDYQPIDGSDACGMNLVNLLNMDWSEDLLQAAVTPPGSSTKSKEEIEAGAHLLRHKLGPVAWSHDVCGTIHSYFQQKFGFSGTCKVVCASGDNPCTVAGLRLEQPGDVAVSLGTSDTVFAVISVSDIAPSGEESHVLRNPVDSSSCMGMICIKNGSLAREHTRDALGINSWDKFNDELGATSPGNGGNIGFFFLEAEITPRYNATGTFRFGPNGNPIKAFGSRAAEVRAIVEGQILNMRLHAKSIGLEQPRRVICTGGGSVNKAILQIIADVFDSKVFTADTGPNTAALGSAYRAFHGYNCFLAGKYLPFSTTFSPRFKAGVVLGAEPKPGNVQIYKDMLPKYAALEKKVLGALA